MGKSSSDDVRAGSRLTTSAAVDPDDDDSLAPGKPPRNWPVLILGIAVLASFVVGVAWLIVTGLIARAQLQDVRKELPQLRAALVAGDVAQAQRLANRIQAQADRAHALTTGPAWWMAANLPGGSPFGTTRALTTAVDRIGTSVLPTVVELGRQVGASQPHDSTIDLNGITALAPQLHRVAGILQDTTGQVASSAGSWLGPVSSARASLLSELNRVDGELSGADQAVRIAVPMLGGKTPQRYFIGFLNEAEARGVGGIPGAFAIARVDHGRVTFEHFGSDLEFKGVRADVDLGAEYNALYGQDDPSGTFPNSDISPDFRDAARIWAGLWRAKTKERIDAAVAIDPTAIGYLLKITGPARTADGELVSANNVVALTQREQYTRFGANSHPQTIARKDYLVGIAKVISRRLTQGGDPHKLVRAASRAAAERRFVVWSADPAIEERLVAVRWAGAVTAPDGTRYTGFVVNNAAASKLDYYLDRAMTYHWQGCSGAATSNATVTLTNRAPAGLPPYVTIRADSAASKARPGDNRLLVTYYATAGAQIWAVSVDGRRQPLATAVENGLSTVTVDLELPRGASRTIRVDVVEPATTGPVTLLRQPLIRPERVSLHDDRCG